MSETGIRVELDQSDPIPLAMRFGIEPGELVALVGPSGSGKSTVLRSIAGLHSPRDGRVTVEGRTWLDRARRVELPTRQRRVGYVFQNYALFPHLTALGNVTAAMPGASGKTRHEAARALLRRVHLSGLEDRQPAQLSGGQQQRVGVARALAGDPRVLLLDEPFAAVDRVTREKLQRELAALRADLHIPILFVTHDLDEAVRLADRIGVIHRGRLLQIAEPERIMYAPASPLVARLVDIRNVFEARVDRYDAATDTTFIEWRGHVIEAGGRADLEPGQPVGWCIPAESVILHRRDRPSRGEYENPVTGTVAEAIRLGEMTHVRIALEGVPETIELSIPTHVARRNRVLAGEPIGVSLRREAIHLMPPGDAPEPMGR
jgi:molybdate transport system ATP-binding protein